MAGDRGDLRHRAIRQCEARDSRAAEIVEVQVLQRRFPECLVPARPETILRPRSAERVHQNGDGRALLLQRSIKRLLQRWPHRYGYTAPALAAASLRLTHPDVCAIVVRPGQPQQVSLALACP